jgi:hypothetical protein
MQFYTVNLCIQLTVCFIDDFDGKWKHGIAIKYDAVRIARVSLREKKIKPTRKFLYGEPARNFLSLKLNIRRP